MVSQTTFDVWDVIPSEMEDTLAEGFKGHHQLPYAHWICFLLFKEIDGLAEASVVALHDSPTVFPDKDMHQLMGHSQGNRVAR
jgi:hypothetical protein